MRYISPTATIGIAAVGGLLEQVAGERAEAARVDRQRDVDAVLRAQERDRPRGIERPGGWTLELGRPRGAPRARGRAPRATRRPRRAAQRRGRGLLEQADRVPQAQLEALGVDRSEQLGAARQPRPAVVVGQAGKRPERLGQPLGELGGRAPDVLAAGVTVMRGVFHVGRGANPLHRPGEGGRRLERLQPDCSPAPGSYPRAACEAPSSNPAASGVLAFGDSITNGGGELQWGVALQSWALWVARGLGLPFTGYAVDGATADDVVDGQIPAFSGPRVRDGALRPRAASTSASTTSAPSTGTRGAFEPTFPPRAGVPG